MERIFLKSSFIESLVYNPDDLILELAFRNKTIYEYYEVPAKVYLELIDAKSHTKYFNSHIKPKFDYKKVG